MITSIKDLRTETDLTWTDISTEQWRQYTFPGGDKVLIENPIALNVSRSGGHRLLDATGASHYIPKGYIHLEWLAKDGAPHFVK